MSLARGISASQAREYYYEVDPLSAPEGKGENSEWYGELQEDLGLHGRIRDEHFSALVIGNHPEVDKTLVPAGVNNERRAGIDFAFSAPKSVSIAALHLGDENILEAHKEAVKSALAFAQDNFIYYREKIDGHLEQVKSDNMIASTFLHTTSRANDPQLHTHAIVLNITKTHDDKFKAISNEQLFQNQTLLLNIYKNQLAINIKELGYSVENYENKFEIKGISEEAIETFSKRSREIDDMYEKIKDDYPGMSEAEVKDIAVLRSRDDKNVKVTAEQLKARWEKEYSKKELTPIMNDNNAEEQPSGDIIGNATKFLHKTESTFNRYDLLSTLLIQNAGKYTYKELEQKVSEAEQKKDIIMLGNADGVPVYSTEDMIRTENCIAFEVRNSVKKSESLIDKASLKQHLPENLTKGQRDFVEHVLTSKDSINIIQGDAGVGKTYAVKVLNDVIEKEQLNKKIVGLGFTGKAAQELSDAANIETSTIASFLLSPKKIANSVIIVDEASMVSSVDMLSVIDKAKRFNNKLVFVGDGKQLQAIGAGKMFKELQKENIIKTIQMEEVLRQETPLMKEAVTMIKDFQTNKVDGKQLCEFLEENNFITEVKSKSKDDDVYRMRIEDEVINNYKTNPDNTIIITPSRAEKDYFNDTIRKNVLDKQSINNSKTITTRESINASGLLANSYKKDDVIILNRKEYRVQSIDVNKNTFELTRQGKDNQIESLTVEPSSMSFISYREKEKDFAVNDKVMFTKNDKTLEVQNGLSGKIKSIDENGNFIIETKNKQITIDPAKYQYLDHGYVQTIHKSQGQTAENTILIHNGKGQLSTEAFYVAATRAKKDFKIITTDATRLKTAIQYEQPKTSTREYVGR